MSKTPSRSGRIAAFNLLPSVAGALSILLGGCQMGSNLEDLAKKLGNPDKETFDDPQLFLEGEYRSLSVDGTSDTGAFVTALRHDNQLAIMPFDSVEECTIGPVRAFRPALIKEAGAKNARIPFITQATDETPEQLRFADFSCKLASVTLDTRALPLHDSFARAGGLVAQDVNGDIWHIDPWKNKKEKITPGTAAVARDNHALFAKGAGGKDWMYTLEEGQIVARDADFAEVFRSQDGVDSFLHHQSRDKSTVLLARRFEEVEADESAEEPNAERIARWYLLALDGAADETLVVENACSMRVMDGVSGRELIYSDCSSGDLLWYSFENEETKLLASKVKAYRVMGNAADGPILMYLERDDSDDSNTGPLYARWGFESPSFLGEGGNLKLSWVSSSGTQRPVVDWKDGTGTLKYGSVGKKLETLAKGVVHVSSAGVISEYDGENGVFSRLSGSELTKVHERVHADGMRADANADRVLLLTDYDDGYGSLVLVSGEQHQLLAKTVQPNAYQYAVSFPMVSVLNDYDAKTGTATLRMVRTDRDQDLEIASGVRESLEIGWPKQGLLFSAPSADPPGIYFARAR